jgi:hypothetical protein
MIYKRSSYALTVCELASAIPMAAVLANDSIGGHVFTGIISMAASAPDPGNVRIAASISTSAFGALGTIGECARSGRGRTSYAIREHISLHASPSQRGRVIVNTILVLGACL